MRTSNFESRSTHQDVHQRTVAFAKLARAFVRRVPKTIDSMGDCRRLVASSGGIGSSYIDADRATNQRAFRRSINCCYRDIRQAQHWAQLLNENLDSTNQELLQRLLDEGGELEGLFAAIMQKPRQK